MTTKAGNVYKYASRHLKQKKKIPHFIPIVGATKEPKKLIVIITTYKSLLEQDLKNKNGIGSYVVLDMSSYSELSHKSIINCKVYEELNSVFKNKKLNISNQLLQEIKNAALKHKQNKPRIKDCLRVL